MNNIVKGMVFLGDTKTANIISRFIRKSEDVTEYKDMLLNGNFSKLQSYS